MEAARETEMTTGRKWILWALALGAAYGIGFVPRYLEARQLRRELAAAREQSDLARLRDLAGIAYLEVTQNNYGVAARHTSELFDRAAELARTTSDAGRRQALGELLGRRDAVTAGLAKADPAVSAALQDLLRRLHAAPLGPPGS
jgi:hypothetical protein